MPENQKFISELPAHPRETDGDIQFSLSEYPPMPPEPTDFPKRSHAQEFPPKLTRAQRIGLRATATVAALGLVSSVSGEVYAGDTELVPKLAIGYFTEQGPGPVPEKIQQHVTNLLHEPTAPALKKISHILDGVPYEVHGTGVFGKKLSKADLARSAAAHKEFDKEYFAYCLQQAEKSNLHVIDSTPYAEKLQEAATVDEVTKVMNDFTAHYGFQVTFDEHTDVEDIGVGVDPIKKETIDLGKFKTGAASFMGSLSYMPVELAEFADIRGFRIVEGLGNAHSGTIGTFQPGGEANPVTGIVYYPINSFYDGGYDVLMHEISHRIDYLMSGAWGMFRDKQFGALNDPDFDYGDPNSPDFDRDLADPYSGTNPVEDKATLFESMLNGLDPNLFLNPSPVIREKYDLLLGRLDQHVPGIADYLSAISDHTRK